MERGIIEIYVLAFKQADGSFPGRVEKRVNSTNRNRNRIVSIHGRVPRVTAAMLAIMAARISSEPY